MLVAIGPLKLWMESECTGRRRRSSERGARPSSETDNTTAKAPSAVPGADRPALLTLPQFAGGIFDDANVPPGL